MEDQFVITSWDKNTNMYEPQTGNQINLPALFKRKTQIDQPILLGSKKRLPMRLVARKLPKQVADERIKKAKKDRHSKARHSKAYYELT